VPELVKENHLSQIIALVVSGNQIAKRGLKERATSIRLSCIWNYFSNRTASGPRLQWKNVNQFPWNSLFSIDAFTTIVSTKPVLKIVCAARIICVKFRTEENVDEVHLRERVNILCVKQKRAATLPFYFVSGHQDSNLGPSRRRRDALSDRQLPI
jgi:hypothetical protein